jgi:hypothetical protein
MVEWAQENRSEFYRGIYARLLPSQSHVEFETAAPRSVEDMTDDELMAIAAGGAAIGAVVEQCVVAAAL